MTDKPLWTNERIEAEMRRVGDNMRPYIADACSVAEAVRDDYQVALDAANARVATLEKIVTELEQQCHSLAADLTADLAGSDAAWDIMSDMMGMEDDDE